MWGIGCGPAWPGLVLFSLVVRLACVGCASGSGCGLLKLKLKLKL